MDEDMIRWAATYKLSRWPTLLSLLALFAMPAAGQEISEYEPGLFVTTPQVLVTPWSGKNTLVIRATNNMSGSLTIAIADIQELQVEFIKKARTTSRSRAFDYIDLMSVSLEHRPEQTQVDIRAPNPAPWNNAVEAGLAEVNVFLPRHSRVEVSAVYFDVNARGPLESLKVTESLGRLEVNRVHGNLELSTANQRVWVTEVSGIISVTTTNASITAKEVAATREAARFRNDGGDIILDDVTGQLNVKNSFGRITIRNFDAGGLSSFIRGFTSPILIDLIGMTDGQLVISNRYEDIDITVPADLSAYLTLSVDADGRIEVDNIPFQADLVRQNRLTLRAGDADASISGSITGNGNIFVHGMEQPIE